MIKRFFILTVSFLQVFTLSFAQSLTGSGKGRVTDDAGAPLDGVVIEVRTAVDSVVSASSVTDSMGAFEFYLGEGQYFLQVSYTGYTDYVSDLFIISAEENVIGFPRIILRPSTSEIAGVTIQGRKNFIEQKIDRVVVNPEALISNAGANATDILKKAPGVMIDENGAVSLKGRGGVAVFIDDKPSFLSGNDLISYLNSLPAGVVDKIELIPNPPARYDAAGNAVINIRLKKNMQQGFNGNINLSLTQGKFTRSNNSLNLNYRIHKLNFFSQLTYNQLNTFQDLHLQRQYFDTSGAMSSAFNQSSYITDRSHGPKLRLGADYYMSSKSVFGFSISGFTWFSKGRTENAADILDAGGIPVNRVSALATSTRPFKNITTNINYSYKPDSTGRELSFNADYLTFFSRTKNTLLNTLYSPDGSIASASDLRGDLPASIHIMTTNGDYTTPFLKKGRLDLGYKFSFINTKNTADFFDYYNGSLQVNNTFSNSFNYKENINAGYVNFNYQAGRLGVQSGLRYENTTINGEQAGNSSTPGNRFKRVFNSFFPTVYLSYEADSNRYHLFNISYARRINRPDYQDMNPFTYPIDRYTLYGGNPYLLPTFSNNIELSYTFKSRVTGTLMYSIINDLISETIEQENGIFYSRPGNIGRQLSYGAALNANLNPVKKWTMNMYANMIRNEFDAEIYGHVLHNAGWNFFMNMVNIYQFNDQWSTELSGMYYSKIYSAQFIMIPSGLINIAVARKILKDKGSLKLSMADIFYSNSLGGEITGLESSSAMWRNRVDSRNVTLAFTYNFSKGSTLGERKRSGADDERGRVK